MTVGQALRVFWKGSTALISVWATPVDRAAETGLARMKALVHERFPGIPHLNTAELAAWLSDVRRIQPVLLDLRSRAEFDVSHLEGARWVEPETTAADLIPTLPNDRPVVLYCSVGYRSAACATRLIRAGFTNLSNLEGSLFQWANEGRPLAREGGVATTVHPYSRRFGRLLKPGLRDPLLDSRG